MEPVLIQDDTGAIAYGVFDAVGVRITVLSVTADKVLAGLRAMRGS